MNAMKITLRQLQFLKAVVEHGNFSRAAERLGTSQPALSLAIREMEDALGLRLFDRTTRRVALTDAGRVFWAAALAGLSEIEHGLADLENIAMLREGTVTLLATPLLAATLLPMVVDRVRRAHPGLQLRIADEGTDRILALVRQGRADLGLGTFREGEEGIRSTPALTDELMAFVGDTHPLAQKSKVDWGQLATCRIAAMAPESSLRFLADEQFERLGLRAIPAVEVHQVYTAIGLVAATDLVAILPAYARTAIHGRAVSALPVEYPVVRREVSLIQRAEGTPSPAALSVLQITRLVPRDLGTSVAGT